MTVRHIWAVATRSTTVAKVFWDMWNFDEVEIDLRDYARENGLSYDERHPLSILPNNAAKTALDATGGTYSEIAKLMPSNAKTVAGWFAPGRNPSRSVVAHNIVPALCEMFVRHIEHNPWRFVFDRGEYISDGKRPSKEYVQTVQSRVFLLLTTGENVSDEDRAKYMARGKEHYYRGVIRYAAAYLEKDELADVAHAALGALIRHATKPSSDREYPDDITNMYRRNQWFFYADSESEKEIYPETITVNSEEIKPDPDDYPTYAGIQLGNSADHHHIQQMSNSYLEHYYDYIDEVLNRRIADDEYFEEQMRREEERAAEEAKRMQAGDTDDQAD